jgi:hypothetical protein
MTLRYERHSAITGEVLPSQQGGAMEIVRLGHITDAEDVALERSSSRISHA